MHHLHHFSVRRGRGSLWRAAGLAGWLVVCLPVVVCLACGGRSFLLLLGHDFARHGWVWGRTGEPDRGAWYGVPAQSRESGKREAGKQGCGNLRWRGCKGQWRFLLKGKLLCGDYGAAIKIQRRSSGDSAREYGPRSQATA